MKRKYVWHEGTFVDVTDWKPTPRKTPYIVRDSMEHAMHPATGEMMDSKSRFREVTRAHGLVEVGNDWRTSQTKPRLTRADRKRDIAAAMEQIESGYTPPPSSEPSELSAVATRVYE